jgi:3-deoxy-manno-octulosonate cytidylyltransferase (CMP-KDO synthetase)
MLERVWRIARAAKRSTRVVVATEDDRVVKHAASFGAEAFLTSDQCTNGTERVFEALKAARIREHIIINLQGDALLTPPWVLDAMIQEMEKDDTIDIVTPAVQLNDHALREFLDQKKVAPASGTTVTFDLKKNAIYFSKSVIPYVRESTKPGSAPIYRHIGLYGYRIGSLEKYVMLPATPLEMSEQLEQLRALEHGMTIRVAIVDYRGRTHASVDAPEDVAFVEKIIAREGELTEITGNR